MAKTDRKTFLPARLVKGHRWYIVFYQINPFMGERERIRETRDLNRIPDLVRRQLLADLILKQINAKLPFGYPFEAAFQGQPSFTNIIDALAVAEKIKCQRARPRTIETLRNHLTIFKRWLVAQSWMDMCVGEFEQKHALAFLDYLIMDRGVGNRTYNNYLHTCKDLFKELQERQYVAQNPFLDFRKKKLQGKKRRAFSEEEREVVIARVAQENTWLLLAVLLQFYCFIRPIELTRLRFGMIDLKEGLIRMPAAVTKNKENAMVTIPDVLLPILKRLKLHLWERNWLIFGKMGRPHENISAARKTLGKQHKRVLDQLYAEGALSNIQGLSFYSWKDTGALELFKRKVNVLEIMKQLRHKDLATTQVYCQSLYSVNKEIKVLDNTLLGDDLLERLLP